MAGEKKYEFIEHLGRGGMCYVDKVRHISLNRVVALKRIKPDLAVDKRELGRFLAEARICSKLRHPNIVEIYEVGEDDESPFIIMEYIEGRSLRAMMDGGLSPGEGLRVCGMVADALAYAHEQNVLHRDLKPENVLVSSDGLVKVVDWGLAKSLADEHGFTRTGLLIGTPGFMAPEQIIGEKLSPAVDIYALGCILYEIVERRPPFDRQAVSECLVSHLKRKLPPVRNTLLPRGLADTLSSMLSKDKDERPGAREVLRILEKVKMPGPAGNCRHAGAGHSGFDPDTVAVDRRDLRFSGPTLRLPAIAVRNKIRYLAIPVVFAVFSLLVCLFIGRDRRPGAAPEPFMFRSARVDSIDRLSLMFSGAAPGKARLQFFDSASGRPVADDVILSFDEIHLVSRSVYAVQVRLSFPLLRRTTLRLLTGDDSSEFTIDPSAYYDRIFAPVDGLEGESLSELLIKVRTVRRDLLLSAENGCEGYFKARNRAEREFRELIGEHGMDTAFCSELISVLSYLRRSHVLPVSPVAGRLLPLRYIETALCNYKGITPPWGKLSYALGFTFACGEDAPPPDGAVCAAAVRLGRMSADRRVLMWLSPRKAIDSHSCTSVTAISLCFEAHELLKSKGELRGCETFPTQGDIKWSGKIDFDIDPSYQGAWPPARAEIELTTVLFSMDYDLRLSFNGGRCFHLLNTYFATHPQGDSDASMKTLKARFPVDCSVLRHSGNSLSIVAAFLPFNGALAAPVGFRMLKLFVFGTPPDKEVSR